MVCVVIEMSKSSEISAEIFPAARRNTLISFDVDEDLDGM